MTENGDPRENAIAERVNGILKEEWLNKEMITTLGQARDIVRKVIDIYNTRRPHSSVEMLTPEEAHAKKGPLKRKWKTIYKRKQPFINRIKLIYLQQNRTETGNARRDRWPCPLPLGRSPADEFGCEKPPVL